MSNIDFSRVISAEDREDAHVETRKARIKAECAARITAILDLPTQQNLQSAMAVGTLSKTNAAAFRRAVTWTAEMRRTCRSAIEKDLPLDEIDWPVVPKTVEDLAHSY